MSVSGFTRANCIVFKQSKRASEQAIKRAGVTVESYEHIKFTIDDCSRPEIRSMFMHSYPTVLFILDVNTLL